MTEYAKNLEKTVLKTLVNYQVRSDCKHLLSK